MNCFPYGTVYKVQREYTHDKIFSDLNNIRDLGLNFVVIWPAVYWWEDKSNKNYPFNTGYEILAYAEKIGLKVIMELAGQLTSLEYAPDFLMKDEYLVMDKEGHYVEFRDGYCPLNFNHPEVKELVGSSFATTVKNYKDYHALYGYDIWNETQLTSYDTYTLNLFRMWLKDKYKDINELNASWDRVYYNWSQIKFTRWNWASVMPYVDYQEFKKENVGMILKEWKSIIKAIDPDHPVIADNVESMVTSDENYARPQDDWNVAENTDEIGFSFYPKYYTMFDHYRRWETLTGNHSAAPTGRFWISELQTHHTTMFLPGSLVYPYELKWWNWEAIAHGAKGIIYWKWHPFIKGVQTFSRGLVNVRGEYTPRAIEAADISRIIKENEKVFMEYEPEQPKVCILYDRLSQEFTKAYSGESSSFYLNSIAGLYNCLWDLNIPAKFVTPPEVINKLADRYKVMFITEQLNIDDKLAVELKNYVEGGGTLICDGKFGDINNIGVLHKEIPGGMLNNILGFQLDDIDVDNMEIKVNWNIGSEIHLKGFFEKRILSILNKNIDVLGKFSDDSPAILRTEYGKGRIIYIATHLWHGYFSDHDKNTSDFLKLLADEYGMRLHKINNNELKVCTLKGERGIILFIFNYNERNINADVELNEIKDGQYTIKDVYSGLESTTNSNEGKILLRTVVTGKNIGIFSINRHK